MLASVRRDVMTAAGGLPVLLWRLPRSGCCGPTRVWAERLAGLDGFHKLLLVPLLLAHFRAPRRADWVIFGFLISARCCSSYLMVSSFIPRPHVARQIQPCRYSRQRLHLAKRNFCDLRIRAVGASSESWRARSRQVAMALAILAGIFIANIAYVATSRTTLVFMAVLLVLLGFWYFGWKGLLASRPYWQPACGTGVDVIARSARSA